MLERSTRQRRVNPQEGHLTGVIGCRSLDQGHERALLQVHQVGDRISDTKDIGMALEQTGKVVCRGKVGSSQKVVERTFLPRNRRRRPPRAPGGDPVGAGGSVAIVRLHQSMLRPSAIDACATCLTERSESGAHLGEDHGQHEGVVERAAGSPIWRAATTQPGCVTNDAHTDLDLPGPPVTPQA